MFLSKDKKIIAKLYFTYFGTFFIVLSMAYAALAGVYAAERKINSIEWTRGKRIACEGGRGIEYYNHGEAASLAYGFSDIAVICYLKNRNNQAKWLIAGGRNVNFQRPSYKTYNTDPGNNTKGYGEIPNVYKYSKFIIGEDCSLISVNYGRWKCSKYFYSRGNGNYLKTYGNRALGIKSGFQFSLMGVKPEDYIETNK